MRRGQRTGRAWEFPTGWRLLGPAAVLFVVTAALWAAVTALVPQAGPVGVVLLVLAVLCAVAVLAGVATLLWRLTEYGRTRGFYGHGGWATYWQLRRHLTAGVVRGNAVVRHDLAGDRARRSTTEYGPRLGTTRLGPLLPVPLYTSYSDVVLVVAPPQTGKTAWLAGAVIDAPGAVVSTSTKADVYHHTAGLRRGTRGPIAVFNPEGLGENVQTTLRWDPVAGCHDPQQATQRAGYLVGGSTAAAGTRDADFFESAAAKVLRSYLLAAALANRGMRQVADWVADPGDDTALVILRHYADRVPTGWTGELAQVMTTRADKTKESIYLTLASAVEFMSDPRIAAVTDVGPAGGGFDVASFIAQRGTVYLLGAERKYGSVAPLLSAFTGYLFEESKRLASRQPNGRLAPPLMFALDEAALITPVPLDLWTSDAGGRGISLVVAVQAPSQLYARWGRHGGDTIASNANCKLYYGGLTNDAELEAVSRLCGERDEGTVTETRGNRGGRDSESFANRRARVCPPERLRQLPRWHVLVLHRSAPPTVVKITPVWDRKDVRAAGARPPQAEAPAPPVPHEARR